MFLFNLTYRLIILFIGLFLSGFNVFCQDNNVEYRVYLVNEYVHAFNTGITDSLALVLEKIYAPEFLLANGGSRSAATDRLELFKTYGPLKFHHIDSTANPPIIWTKGTITHGWVGYQFKLNDESIPKITRVTTWRARPIPFPNNLHSDQEVRDSLHLYIQNLANKNLFSGSVTLSHHGKIILNESWGTDKQKSPAAINQNTRFHIASVTKLFTVVALLQLVEQGKVSLDSTIDKYIPEYPKPYGEQITVRHLLTHTSGIKLNQDSIYLEETRKAKTLDDFLAAHIRAVKRDENISQSGSEYNYSSEGIDLLGVITERVSGQSWHNVIKTEIFEPVGMIHSRTKVPIEEGEFAIGKTNLSIDLQTIVPGEEHSALEILPNTAKPSSGIWSTAYELHLFMDALLEHRLLSKEWTNKMLSENIITFELEKYGIRSWVGLGAQGEDLWGVPTVGHGGVVPGYSSAIEYLPNNEWLFTVVSNTGEATGFLIFQRALELTINGNN